MLFLTFTLESKTKRINSCTDLCAVRCKIFLFNDQNLSWRTSDSWVESKSSLTSIDHDEKCRSHVFSVFMILSRHWTRNDDHRSLFHFQLNSTSLSSFAWLWEAYENRWSHQRRRRRGHSVDEQTTPPASKRLKSDAEPLNKLCTLQARLDEHQGVCSLYLLFVDGTDADAANQIGQYIKNQFPSYCQRNNIGQWLISRWNKMSFCLFCFCSINRDNFDWFSHAPVQR